MYKAVQRFSGNTKINTPVVAAANRLKDKASLNFKVIKSQAETQRMHNFSAGPSALPQHILEEVQDELLNYRSSGASFMELSHRDVGGPVQNCMQRCVQQLEALLDVPQNYQVLFFQGGAHAQFAGVPLNLCAPGDVAAFGRSGFWSDRFRNEAGRFCRPQQMFDCEDWQYRRLPKVDEWKVPAGAKFASICANETIHGLELLQDPGLDGPPLVLDATSTLLSRQLDISKYGVVFASSGKNLGPAGICTVIVRDDLVDRSRELDRVPAVLSWPEMADSKPIPNIYNTPPTFNFYMLEKVLDDYLERGGLKAIEQNNAQRAERLYELIDASGGFYSNHVEPASRSRMNVPFRIGNGDVELEQRFTNEAENFGLMQVFGHPLFGGQRITLYNNIADESVDEVIRYMSWFKQQYAHKILS